MNFDLFLVSILKLKGLIKRMFGKLVEIKF